MRYDGGAGELAAAVSQRGSVGEYTGIEGQPRHAVACAPPAGA